MKTSSSSVVIVLTLLLSIFVDASTQKKSVTNLKSPRFPNHFLLSYNPYSNSTSSSTATGTAAAAGSSNSDEMVASSSLGISAQNFDDDSVAKLLLNLKESSPNSEDLESPRSKPKKSSRSRPVFKAGRNVKPNKLKKMSQNAFCSGRVKNFENYFDESNIGTEGNEWLMKCFHSSLNFGLAADLIAKGARLPVSDETFSGIFSIDPSQVDSEVPISILMELIKADPEQAISLFLGAANVTEEKEKLDLLLMSLISEESTAAVLCSNPSASPILAELVNSGKFDSTSLRIIEIMAVLGVQPREEDVIKMYGISIEARNFQLVEAILKQRWLDVHKRVFFGSSADYSPIFHLFGKFSSNVIMRLIREVGYNLAFTHDSVNNPNGDILLVAMFANDLESFKRLLLAGASYNVKLTKSDGSLVTLEDRTRSRKPEYYAAIQSFKNGTLQTEIEN